MDRLITVQVMRERYGCSLPTARKYIRQIEPHLENPLATYEWALLDWEEKRTVHNPVSRKRKAEIIKRQKTGRVIVPRTREG